MPLSAHTKGAACLGIVLAIQGIALPARADDTKRRCVSAYDQGQRLRQAQRLTEARAELRECSADACPAVIAHDCAAWLREVHAAIPTIVVAARSADGVDVLDARVTIDGQLLQERPTGGAIEVDPGEHTIRVESARTGSAERRILVNAGEKDRLIALTLAPAEPLRPSTSPAPPPHEREGSPTIAYVLGAAGAAATVAGAVIDVTAYLRLRDLRATCAPTCAESDASSTQTQMVVGDVIVGAGLVTLGVAAWMFLQPRASAPSTSAVLTPTGPLRFAF